MFREGQQLTWGVGAGQLADQGTTTRSVRPWWAVPIPTTQQVRTLLRQSEKPERGVRAYKEFLVILLGRRMIM